MALRGINVFAGSGAAGEITWGTVPTDQSKACSFLLVMGDKGGREARIRVNVYGGLVAVCEAKLQVGTYVVVMGELMNRGNLLEVRAKDIAFVVSPQIG